MTKLFTGCGTALVTPFRQDGSIDYEAYAGLVDRQIDKGVDFLVPVATTAETPALTQDEKARLLEITKEHAKGHRIIAGVGVNCVRDTLANIKLLEPYGPDAFLVVVPYYNKPTQEGQYQYFKTVAAETSLPVIIYNVPGRTGANMLPDTVLGLAQDCPNIIGVKEASGNYSQVCEILRRAPKGFCVLSGDDDLTMALMASGADGVISVASNVAPAEVSEMVHAAMAEDYRSARALLYRLFPLFKGCFVESNPIPVKEALAQMGLCARTMRLPLVEASEETSRIIAGILAELF